MSDEGIGREGPWGRAGTQQAAQPPKRCLALAAREPPVSWNPARASSERDDRQERGGAMRQREERVRQLAGRSRGHKARMGLASWRVQRGARATRQNQISDTVFACEGGQHRWRLREERRAPKKWRRAIGRGAERRRGCVRGSARARPGPALALVSNLRVSSGAHRVGHFVDVGQLGGAKPACVRL